VAVVAAPMIYRRGKSQPGQSLLERDYLANLLIILACIAVGTGVAYLVRVRRDVRLTTYQTSED
jgi:hypothetical protein